MSKFGHAVNQARKIRRTAAPEVMQAVERGALTLHPARVVESLSPTGDTPQSESVACQGIAHHTTPEDFAMISVPNELTPGRGLAIDPESLRELSELLNSSVAARARSRFRESQQPKLVTRDAAGRLLVRAINSTLEVR